MGAGYREDKTREMPKTGLWRCSGAWGHSYEGFSQRRRNQELTQSPWKELPLFLANCTTEQVPSFKNGGNLPEAEGNLSLSSNYLNIQILCSGKLNRQKCSHTQKRLEKSVQRPSLLRRHACVTHFACGIFHSFPFMRNTAHQ